MGGLTYRELQALVSWARSGSRRVRIRLSGYRYSISISRYIRAVDPSGRVIPWGTAFGTRAPHDVLSSFKVEEVVVEEGGEEKSFKSLEELLRYAGIR
ncbi:MAG: hypothetical protein DRK00_02155 [Thermoprotei archaeon]|nr:MAG: hypothetical protein DRK00_02155 [Thermoprotei archaeon]